MDVKEILNERLQNDYRAEQMKTSLINRLQWSRLNSRYQAPETVYRECLEVLNKEFFELNLPIDYTIDKLIHERKEEIVNKIYPHDERKHMKSLTIAGKIADIIEGMCYEMFNHGYNYALGKNIIEKMPEND